MRLKILGLQGAKSFTQIRIATQNMSVADTAAALASSGLNEAQQIKILMLKGVSSEEAATMVQTYGFVAAESAATAETNILSSSMTGLKTALHGLKAAFMSNPIGFVVTAAVTVISILVSLSNTIQGASEKLEESSDKVKELESDITGLCDELDTTQQRISELLRKDHLTIIEKDELEKLKQTNAELERQKSLKESTLKTERAKLESDFVNAVGEQGYVPSFEWYNQRQQGMGNDARFYKYIQQKTNGKVKLDEIDRYGDYILTGHAVDFSGEKWDTWASEFVTGLTKCLESLSEYDYEDLSDKAKDAVDYINDVQNTYLAASDKVKDVETAFQGIYNQERFSEGKEAIEKLKESGTLTSQALEKLYQSNDSVKALVDNMKKVGLVNYYASDSFDYLANQILEIDDATKAFVSDEASISAATEEIAKKIDDLNAALDDIQNVVSTVQEVSNNFNENGYYSTDDLQKLLSINSEYINLLIDENGQINTNSEAYKTYLEVKAKSLVLSQVESLYNNILGMTAEEAQAYANAKAYEEEAGSLEELISRKTEYYYSLALAQDNAQGTTAYTDAMKRSLDTVSNYMSVYDSWLNSLSSSTNEFTKQTNNATNALENQKKALEDQKNALENQKQALEDQKKALEDQKKGYNDGLNAIKDLVEWVEKYIKQTKEDEVEALEKKKNAIGEAIDKQKELLQAEKDEYDWNKSIGEKRNNVASAVLASVAAGFDNSSSGKKAQKKAREEQLKAEKDLQDTLYTHNIEVREKALDEAKEDSDNYYNERIEKIREYLNDETRLYKDACAMIDNDNGTLYSRLLNYCQTYTTVGRAEFDFMWNEAQRAMERYNTANLSTFSLLNMLQGKMYEVDNAINTISSSIETYESRISDVKTQLENLTESANAAANAIRTANSISLNNTPSTTPSTSSQKPELRIAKTVDLGNAPGVISNMFGTSLAPTYYVDYGRIRYKIKANSVFEAATAINRKLPITTPIKASDIHRYASGTRGAFGGLSLVDEQGIGSELIPATVGKGRYTILPQGNPVFSKAMTDELFNFASSPQNYIQKAVGSQISKVSNIKNNSAEIHNNVNIDIRGDATQSTITALRAEANNIVKQATDSVIDKVLRGRNWR